MSEIIRIYRLSELESMPDPSWMVHDVLHHETLAAVAGNRGSFKTFLCLDWGLTIASDLTTWNGRPVSTGNVLHVVGEGGRGIKRRAQAWRQEHGLDFTDTTRWACTVKPVDLLEHADWLAEAVEEAYSGEPLALLVVDTLARNQSGDENSTKEMSRLIVQADRLKDQFGCTVLFAHHMNRAGSFRGNSALDGAFDTIVQLDRKKNAETITVSCDKQKDAEEFDSFVLKRRHVDLPNGVRSMVLDPDADSSPQMGGVLKIVDMAGQRGVTHQDAMQAAADANLCKSTAFNEAWSKARQKELIVMSDESPKGKGALWVRNLALIDLAA